MTGVKIITGRYCQRLIGRTMISRNFRTFCVCVKLFHDLRVGTIFHLLVVKSKHLSIFDIFVLPREFLKQ